MRLRFKSNVISFLLHFSGILGRRVVGDSGGGTAREEGNSEEQTQTRTIFIKLGKVVNDPRYDGLYEAVDTWSDDLDAVSEAQGNDDIEDSDDDDDVEAGHERWQSQQKSFYLNLKAKDVEKSLAEAIEESENYHTTNPDDSVFHSFKYDDFYIANRQKVFGGVAVQRHYYNNDVDYYADMCIMQEIIIMLQESNGMTQRGLYYALKGRLSVILQTTPTKESFDDRINLICNITGWTRSELNIIVPSKSTVKGPLVLERKEEIFHNIPYGEEKVTVVRLAERIDFRSERQPLNHLIVNDFLGVDSHKEKFHPVVHRGTRPKVVLMVETTELADRIDSSLLFNPAPNDSSSSMKKIPVMVVCTGGAATFYPRFFLKRMTRGPFGAIPCATGDVGPHGFKIIQNLMKPMRYDKVAQSFNDRETRLLEFLDDVRVIAVGPFASDVKMQIEKDASFEDHLQEWKDSDATTLTSITDVGNLYSYVNVGVENEARKADMELMREGNIKCEAEVFNDIVLMLYRRIKAIRKDRKRGRDEWKGTHGM